MAPGRSTRLTASRRGRRFGFTVGAAFLCLGALVWWRGAPAAAAAALAAGGTLALAGLAIPDRLGPVEALWMRLAVAISRVTTPIVFTAMYLLVVWPIGALRCALGGNPLVHREQGGSYWRPRPEGARRTKSLKRQF